MASDIPTPEEITRVSEFLESQAVAARSPGGASAAGGGARQKQRAGITTIGRFFEAINNRDYATMRSLLGNRVKCYTYFGRDPVSPDAILRAMGGMLQTFPDWKEVADEIIPDPDGETFTVRQTGRGTQLAEYLGRQPDNRQIAANLVTVLKVRDGKIVEYRSTFPFRRPWDEEISAATDVEAVRAEQGGMAVPPEEWTRTLQELASGSVSPEDLESRKAQLATETPRCEALLASNMRRCLNRAVDGSQYCEIHQDPGASGSFGA
jgi:ketosteroid isomerase-like protein